MGCPAVVAKALKFAGLPVLVASTAGGGLSAGTTDLRFGSPQPCQSRQGSSMAKADFDIMDLF
jgi:hypothetical protein